MTATSTATSLDRMSLEKFVDSLPGILSERTPDFVQEFGASTMAAYGPFTLVFTKIDGETNLAVSKTGGPQINLVGDVADRTAHLLSEFPTKRAF